MGREIGVGGVELHIRQDATVRADLFAAEAEAAIDRASQQGFQQGAVRVAVDDAGDGREFFVRDGVSGFMRRDDQLGGAGDELQADGIVR